MKIKQYSNLPLDTMDAILWRLNITQKNKWNKPVQIHYVSCKDTDWNKLRHLVDAHTWSFILLKIIFLFAVQ